MSIPLPICYLTGYVGFSAEGGSPARFLQAAADSGIPLWHVRREGITLSACCAARHYARLRRPARRAGLRLHLTRRRGLGISPAAAARAVGTGGRTGAVSAAVAAAVLPHLGGHGRRQRYAAGGQRAPDGAGMGRLCRRTDQNTRYRDHPSRSALPRRGCRLADRESRGQRRPCGAFGIRSADRHPHHRSALQPHRRPRRLDPAHRDLRRRSACAPRRRRRRRYPARQWGDHCGQEPASAPFGSGGSSPAPSGSCRSQCRLRRKRSPPGSLRPSGSAFCFSAGRSRCMHRRRCPTSPRPVRTTACSPSAGCRSRSAFAIATSPR